MNGEASNYDGWRISTKGKRFRIKGAKLFNVADAAGEGSGGWLHMLFCFWGC